MNSPTLALIKLYSLGVRLDHAESQRFTGGQLAAVSRDELRTWLAQYGKLGNLNDRDRRQSLGCVDNCSQRKGSIGKTCDISVSCICRSCATPMVSHANGLT